MIEVLEPKINSFKSKLEINLEEITDSSKDSTRSIILERHMESLNLELSEVPTTIPLSVGSRVAGVDVQNCSYFSSATVPLRLSFISDASTDPTLELPPLIPAIYKVGDDLRTKLEMIYGKVKLPRLLEVIFL